MKSYSRCLYALLCLVVVGTTSVGVGRAQDFESPNPTAAPAPVIRDEVRTREGAIVRGLIVEMVPGHHVVIQAPSGELHHYEWDALVYVGSIEATNTATGAPPASTELTPPSTPDARAPTGPNGELAVPFEAVPGQVLELFVDPSGGARTTGRMSTVRLRSTCTSPCTVLLNPGFQRLALARAGERPIWSREHVVVQPGIRLSGELVSRRSQRLGGVVAGILVMGAGAALIGTAHQSVSIFGDSTAYWNGRRLMGGVILASLGLGVTIGIGRGLRDRAVFHVTRP